MCKIILCHCEPRSGEAISASYASGLSCLASGSCRGSLPIPAVRYVLGTGMPLFRVTPPANNSEQVKQAKPSAKGHSIFGVERGDLPWYFLYVI